MHAACQFKTPQQLYSSDVYKAWVASLLSYGAKSKQTVMLGLFIFGMK